jgi:hypothetical protein
MLRNGLRLLLTLPVIALALGATPVAGPTPVAAASTGATISPGPDFTVKVNPLSQTRKRGTGAPFFVTINCLNGFNGAVTLGLSGNIPPNGIVSTTNPTGCGPLHDGDVSLEIQKRTITTGTFAMTIHVFGAGTEHDVNISLTIV